ncbi:hypothetical protein M747DRAFT_37745 [Aspergillus niger ATCC 13496]|uniref:Uncharacterized protein n=1 Tax=Aspergillus niger ATCC 13496 TaxID=1353008 RepID=A0A370BYE0_ASPNG|nr:hypothetical protein M747DRAFT_37745 [Aspergillus niger ATCC 13496]
MEWASNLFAAGMALIFLLLRLRRRTRFFLHLALIFEENSKLIPVSQSLLAQPDDEALQPVQARMGYSHFCEDEEMVARMMESGRG